MNRCTCAKSLLIAAVAAASATASAGQLGATSTGTVSISVTIPPHLTVEMLPMTADSDSPAATSACIVTGGAEDYHVALLPAEGSGTLEPLPMTGRGAARRSCLADAATSLLQERGPGGSSGGSAPTAGPVTLLVVPD